MPKYLNSLCKNACPWPTARSAARRRLERLSISARGALGYQTAATFQNLNSKPYDDRDSEPRRGSLNGLCSRRELRRLRSDAAGARRTFALGVRSPLVTSPRRTLKETSFENFEVGWELESGR